MSEVIGVIIVLLLFLTMNFLDGFGDVILLRGHKIYSGLLKNVLVAVLFFGVAHACIYYNATTWGISMAAIAAVLVRISTFYIFHNWGAGLKWSYIGRLKWYDRFFWWVIEKSPVKYLRPQPWAILSILSIASFLFAIQMLRYTFHIIDSLI